jgi:hypothetical protein
MTDTLQSRPFRPLRFTVAVVAAAVTLFVWSGLTQVFPWGVPTVRNVAQTTEDPASFGAQPVRKAPGALTTAAFDEVLGDGLSTLTTDRSFAWIVSVPLSRYDPMRYFAFEFASQLACSIALVLAMWLLSPLSGRRRAAVGALFGLAACVATYGVMANWWGLPVPYAAGMSLNLVIGWLLAGAVSSLLTNGGHRAPTQ